jgi:drug/metabolite transporter (DMT)-like permease
VPESGGPMPVGTNQADRSTLVAFTALVIIGGSNAVAVRFSNGELPPFWGAAARFGLAAAIFWGILLVRRVAVPKGRALVGAVLYGTLAVGASYALLYWAILEIQASLFMVILSLGPLLTMFFAVAHRLEPFRWRGLAGALIAVAGIAIGIGTQLGRSVPIPSLVAAIVGAACIAEGSVVYKLFPGEKPLPTNALAFTTGAVILLAVSLVAGESWFLPREPRTIAAFIYLVVVGSVLLFYLYLLVLSRWSASATSYAFLLFPVATVVIAAVLTNERVTWQFLLGAAIALGGVWIGAVSRPAKEPSAEERAVAEAGRCDPPYPGCA